MRPYDYANRQGVHELTWDDVFNLADELAEKLSTDGVEAVVGLARAGLFPATSVAISLRVELYPARISRRINDEVAFATPQWRVPVSPDVAGKVVALVDEMADTGETLRLAVDAVQEQGASRVITSSLVAHSWADPMPDHVALISDALVLFPWDREVYIDGAWQPHPDLAEALELAEQRAAGEEP